MGYTNVSYMDPGFSGWKKENLPYVVPSKE